MYPSIAEKLSDFRRGFVEMEVQTKTVVTVAEMARMVGLSRARFYQLIGSAFPWPIYDVSTKRPYYLEEMQRICLEVRRRNCGIDGKPILFYARRFGATPARPARSNMTSKHADLVEGLKSLGLTSVNGQQIDSALKVLYPGGTNGVSDTE